MEYIVIDNLLTQNESLSDFVNEVNDKIKQGWEPLGGIQTVLVKLYEFDYIRCVQTMIKK